MIEPWDKSVLNGIVHALNASDLGITPSSDGTPSSACRSPRPPRSAAASCVKECREIAEQARVSIRNIRRDVNGKLERDEELSEDEVRREQAKVQKHTDAYIKKIDEMLKAKEAEVMEI